MDKKVKLKSTNEKIYRKIIWGYLIPTIIAVVLSYPLLPYLLNYPPDSVNNAFQLKVVPTYYWVYYVVAGGLGVLFEYFYLAFKFKQVKMLEYKEDYNLNDDIKCKLCEKLYNLSNQSFVEILFVPIVVLGIVFALLKVDTLLTIKIIAVIFIIITVSISISYIYIRNKLKIILESIGNIKKPKKFSSILKGTYIQFIPFTLTSVMITGLIILAQFSYKYSDSLYNINMNKLKDELEDNHIDNEYELNQFINNKMADSESKKDERLFFYVTNDNDVIFANGMECSIMFKEYFKEYSKNNGGRVYENYGVECQGIAIYTPYSSNIQAIGYRFTVIDGSIYAVWLVTTATILLFNMIILYFYSASLRGEINSITTRISNLNKEKNIGGFIPITSNDEIGLLQNEYNELQGVTQKYIEELNEKQDIIVKQQQLVSIGELAGGVAHDINTPISAIKTGILMLNTMMAERTESEKELLVRMDNCATKIITIVNSMRNQIRNLGSDINVKFKISDVVKDIKTITYHEVKKNNAEIIINITHDIEITGDPTKLGQVLTNLIVNAAQAYNEGQNGKIEIEVTKSPDNMAMIKVTDYAGGIDKAIMPYIFKNILTTKGTSGTGLGLYLAYSVIKGNFNGEITFDTQEGIGTTFCIIIPIE